MSPFKRTIAAENEEPARPRRKREGRGKRIANRKEREAIRNTLHSQAIPSAHSIVPARPLVNPHMC
jgi:hypothetical protein